METAVANARFNLAGDFSVSALSEGGDDPVKKLPVRKLEVLKTTAALYNSACGGGRVLA